MGEELGLDAAHRLDLRPRRRAARHFDGTGYPDRLAGEEIPLAARIVAVCDTYDAIVSDRAYHAGRSAAEAAAELRRCAGTQFDPRVVDAAIAVLERRGLSEQAPPAALVEA